MSWVHPCPDPSVWVWAFFLADRWMDKIKGNIWGLPSTIEHANAVEPRQFSSSGNTRVPAPFINLFFYPISRLIMPLTD